MNRIVFLLCFCCILLFACTGQPVQQPTVDIQRAVDLTVTAIASTLTAVTPIPQISTPLPVVETPTPTSLRLPAIPDLPGCDLKNSDLETGLVVKVVDGDTIDVLIAGKTSAVRYIGIDTAETGEPYGREARSANASLVDGQKIVLARDVSETDAFERLLRYVFLTDGTFVNEQLVRMGVAEAKPYPPDTACRERFELVQEEAQRLGIGIWAPEKATETPPSGPAGASILVDPSCSQFNAPGDDNTNLNEEFVCLRNSGETAVDLTGWTVEDEYGWIYTFPQFLLTSGELVLIHTGCNTDGEKHVYWCRTETAIWNNSGDCIHLKDHSGEIILEYCY